MDKNDSDDKEKCGDEEVSDDDKNNTFHGKPANRLLWLSGCVSILKMKQTHTLVLVQIQPKKTNLEMIE